MAAEGPTVISNGYEKASWQTIHNANLTAQQRYLTTKTHRANSKLVSILHNIVFQLAKVFYRINILHFAEQLLLSQLVASRTVTADTHANKTGTTALSLRLIYRV
ncbi:hypothetical protein D3C75_647560 [compost metagenome]